MLNLKIHSNSKPSSIYWYCKDMSKNFIFICEEKVLKNLLKYNKLKDFQSLNQSVITPEHIAVKYSEVDRIITYKSTWDTKNISRLTDYFLLKNLFNRNNRSLNIFLRVRFFGPYKIRNFKGLLISARQFTKFIMSIKWLILIKNINASTTTLMKILKTKRIISSNDIELFKYLLRKNHVKSVLVFATFKNPQVLDFTEACKELSIPVYLVPDCWDNIATAPAMPEHFSKIFLLSTQQKQHFNQFYPNFSSRTKILGSYRFEELAENIKHHKFINITEKKRLKVLYLEGYFYEDLEFTINQIVKCLCNNNSLFQDKFEITILIRHYPWPRQTGSKDNKIFASGKTFKLNNIQVSVQSSINESLEQDLKNIDLAFSELSTVGLETLFKDVPVVFVGCKKSPRYLDTMTGYSFPFADKLAEYFLVVNLSKIQDRNLLNKHLESFFLGMGPSYLNNYSSLSHYNKLRYFAEPIKSKELNSILRVLSHS